MAPGWASCCAVAKEAAPPQGRGQGRQGVAVIRTVRTIVETNAGTGRSGTRTNLLRRREFDRLRAAEYRARKRARKELPKKISRTLEQGEILIKAAKGLGG